MRLLIPFLICWSATAADVAGKWNVTAATPGGREYKLEMELRNEGGKLSGEMSSAQGSTALQDVLLSGDQLSYKLPVGANTYSVKFTVAGSTMKGTWAAADGSGGSTTATRAAGAAAVSPAAVTGKWDLASKSDSGRERKLVLEVASQEGNLSGTITAPEGSVPLTQPKLEGNQFTFQLVVDDATYTVKLAVAGAAMKGSYTGTNGDNGTVTAQRM